MMERERDKYCLINVQKDRKRNLDARPLPEFYSCDGDR